MSADDRALAGRGHRPRTSTPPGGVTAAAEEVDTDRDLIARARAASDDDASEWGGPTPVQVLITAVERDLGEPLGPELRHLAEAMWRHGRAEAERTSNRILELAAQHPPEATVAAEVERLRGRTHEIDKVAADALRAAGAAAASAADLRADFRRWTERHDARVAAEAERRNAGRWKLYTGIASAVVASLIPAVLGLIAAAEARATKDAAIGELAEDQRDHEERLRALERATTWRARTHSPPVDVPAPTPGDPP